MSFFGGALNVGVTPAQQQASGRTDSGAAQT
jgi:hypothetical protein